MRWTEVQHEGRIDLALREQRSPLPIANILLRAIDHSSPERRGVLPIRPEELEEVREPVRVSLMRRTTHQYQPPLRRQPTSQLVHEAIFLDRTPTALGPIRKVVALVHDNDVPPRRR